MHKCVFPRCKQTGACLPGCSDRRIADEAEQNPSMDAEQMEQRYRLLKGDTPIRISPQDERVMEKALEEIRGEHIIPLPYGSSISSVIAIAQFKILSRDRLDPVTENYPVGQMPTKSKEGDAAYDLYISRDDRVLIDGMTDLHTDIAIALPPGYFGRITGRSSTLRKRGLLVNEGIVDNGYRGEMFIAVFNLSEKVVEVKAGERLAQLVIQRIETVEWKQVDELPGSERGTNGFGSTGV